MFLKFRIKLHAHRRTRKRCKGLAYLKIGDVPSGEEFGAAGKQFFRRNPDGFQGKIAPSSGQKARRLGMSTFFKQALGARSVCARGRSGPHAVIPWPCCCKRNMANFAMRLHSKSRGIAGGSVRQAQMGRALVRVTARARGRCGRPRRGRGGPCGWGSRERPPPAPPEARCRKSRRRTGRLNASLLHTQVGGDQPGGKPGLPPHVIRG